MRLDCIVASSHSHLTPSYIFNRGWIDRDAKRVPTYKEITSNGKSKSQAQGADSDFENGNDEVLDSDEFDDVVDDFESSYNFRFEEPYVLL